MSSRIFPTIALIISAVIFFFYVGPTWSGQIAKTKSAIAVDKDALKAAEQYTKQQNQLAAARDAIDPENMTLLTTFLPNSVDNVRLILDLTSLATRSQLLLSNINVTKDAKGTASANTGSGALPSSNGDNLGSVDLSLSATGTFTALQDFLVGIEKSARLLDVRTLSVKGSDTGVYSYSMLIRLYWLR